MIRDSVHTVFQGLTAVAAVAALLFTARSLDYTAEATNANREQVRLVERGQVTERFSRAIDQLGQTGDDKLSIRLGGIYALERLMRDSPPDEPTVIEVLCAFVRTASPRPDPVPDLVPPSPPDVRAAVTVLARRPAPNVDDHSRLDLSRTLLGINAVWIPGASLVGVWLGNADLSGAYLIDADLRYTVLTHANLGDVFLSRANLRGADLYNAKLGGARLQNANLDGARLRRAYLGKAVLTGANLHDADLNRADLAGANLAGADLSNADLTGADLRGADLSNANLSGASLSDAKADSSTRLPEGTHVLSPIEPTR